MKLLLPPILLLALCGSSGEPVRIAFAPEEGTTLARTFEARADYHMADLQLSVDGNPIEQPEGLPESSLAFLERISVSDEIRSLEEGRPTELVRTFDELLQESTQPQGDEEVETTSGSPLEGRSVRFTWDAEDETYRVESADDEELDEDLRDGLAEDMDLRAVLPAEEVEPGDEWEIGAELYLAFMWPAGLLDFHDEGTEEADEQDREMNRETIERLEGKGTARFEELREEEGLRLAAIHVELEITTGCDGELEEGALQVEVEIERTIEGTILWDLEHGHVHSAELQADARRLTTRNWTVVNPEGDELELEEAWSLEGTIHYAMTVKRE